MAQWVFEQHKESRRAARLRRSLSSLKVGALLSAGVPAEEADAWLEVAQSLPEGIHGPDNDRNLRKTLAARASGLTAEECMSWAVAGQYWPKIVPDILAEDEPNRLHHAGWDGYTFALLFEHMQADVVDAESGDRAVYRMHRWTGTGIPTLVVLFYLRSGVTAGEALAEWEPLRAENATLWEDTLRTLVGLRTTPGRLPLP
jgi:hypothetical protein